METNSVHFTDEKGLVLSIDKKSGEVKVGEGYTYESACVKSVEILAEHYKVSEDVPEVFQVADKPKPKMLEKITWLEVDMETHAERLEWLQKQINALTKSVDAQFEDLEGEVGQISHTVNHGEAAMEGVNCELSEMRDDIGELRESIKDIYYRLGVED